ncbi:TonB-dependent receptor domain-containing protein [Chitinophagaceae bacterium LWZ2-11]
MQTKIFLFFAWLLLCGYSQAQTKVAGLITGSTNKPLAFVSITLMEGNNFVTSAISNENGTFQISAKFADNKQYSIKLSLIGYKSFSKTFIYPDTAFIRRIILLEDAHTLSDVSVTFKKPLLTTKSDRYIINVENSFLATGNTGLEVLQKSPGIWVDNSGAIRIKGTQSVTIMINDVIQQMSGEELEDYLKTLKSEDISKIEVISNPPAEYEASGSGGIIHIILKKARKDGLSGSVNAQYRQQGKKPYASTSAALDYKLKNLYLLGNISFSKDESYFYSTTSMTYPDKSSYSSYTNRDNDFTRTQYRFGAGYDLTKNQSITIQTIRGTNKLAQTFVTDSYLQASQLITGLSDADRARTNTYSSNTFNYLWKIDSTGSMLKVIADYSPSDKTEVNHFTALFSDTAQNFIYRTGVPNTTNVYSGQADLTKILQNKTEIKTGIKYSSIKRSNRLIKEDYLNGTWIENTSESFQFTYTESLLMAYTSVEKRINRTNIKAGLRAEETYSNGNSITSNQVFSRSYFGLFPSIFITQTLNEAKGNSVHLNYSRRIERPTLSDLNPYRVQFDNSTALTGNPNLSPQYTQNIEAGVNLLHDYSANIYVAATGNVITLLANPASGNTIEYQSVNLNNSLEYGLLINAPYKILKDWSTQNNFSAYHLSYTFNNTTLRQTAYAARTVHTITLKNVFDIDAIADYRSPYTYSNLKTGYTFSFDVGFTRRVLNNKGKIRLYFADIFNTVRELEITDYANTHIVFYRKKPTQNVSLSFSYNFSSGKKFITKKVDQSTGDERSRTSN